MVIDDSDPLAEDGRTELDPLAVGSPDLSRFSSPSQQLVDDDDDLTLGGRHILPQVGIFPLTRENRAAATTLGRDNPEIQPIEATISRRTIYGLQPQGSQPLLSNESNLINRPPLSEQGTTDPLAVSLEIVSLDSVDPHSLPLRSNDGENSPLDVDPLAVPEDEPLTIRQANQAPDITREPTEISVVELNDLNVIDKMIENREFMLNVLDSLFIATTASIPITMGGSIIGGLAGAIATGSGWPIAISVAAGAATLGLIIRPASLYLMKKSIDHEEVLDHIREKLVAYKEKLKTIKEPLEEIKADTYDKLENIRKELIVDIENEQNKPPSNEAVILIEIPDGTVTGTGTPTMIGMNPEEYDKFVSKTRPENIENIKTDASKKIQKVVEKQDKELEVLYPGGSLLLLYKITSKIEGLSKRFKKLKIRDGYNRTRYRDATFNTVPGRTVELSDLSHQRQVDTTGRGDNNAAQTPSGRSTRSQQGMR